MLVRDEVAFAPTYSLLYGLLDDPKEACVVGGQHPKAAKIPCGNDGLQGLSLDPSLLSPLSVTTALKRVDKRSDLFVIQQVPRSRVTTAAEEFQEMGRIADACATLGLCLALFDIVWL